MDVLAVGAVLTVGVGYAIWRLVKALVRDRRNGSVQP